MRRNKGPSVSQKVGISWTGRRLPAFQGLWYKNAASYFVVHMSQLRRLVGVDAPVQSQGSPGGGRICTGTGFASNASVSSRQHRSADDHIQSSVNRRVTAVPTDLSLTRTGYNRPPQQRHYREVNTNIRSGLCYQLPPMKCPKTWVFIIMCHMFVATGIAVCSYTLGKVPILHPYTLLAGNRWRGI